MSHSYLKILIILLLALTQGFGQIPDFNRYLKNPVAPSVDFYQLKDTLFGRPQIISVLELHHSALQLYKVEFAYHRTQLIKTSEFAFAEKALAAVNGGFFDMKNGGSVTYFEVNDSTIHFTHNKQRKWEKPGSMMNGAIVITRDNQVDVQEALPDGYYEESGNEHGVLITGPLLILNSLKRGINNDSFATTFHPRTCLCETENSVLLITIDGRRPNAWGMSLPEVQDLLIGFRCVDAINLDGGGSTTMWLQNRIVNQPSDFTGERPVANAILIVEKNGRN